MTNMHELYKEYMKLNDGEYLSLSKFYTDRHNELNLIRPKTKQEFENSYRFSITYPYICLKHTDYLADTIMKLFPDKDISILDFGAGTGMNLLKLAENNYKNLYYYDINIIMRDFFDFIVDKNNYKITNLKELNNDLKVDLLICQEVIEHIEEYEEFVKYIINYIKIGGYLIAVNQFAKDENHYEHFQETKNFDELMTELNFEKVSGKIWKKN